MKKPKKPYKPKEPVKPKKIVKKEGRLYLEEGQTLQSLLDDIPKDINPEQVSFEVELEKDFYTGEVFYANTYFQYKYDYKFTKEEYDKLLKSYNKKHDKYLNKMDEYHEKLDNYRTEMEVYLDLKAKKLKALERAEYERLKALYEK